MPGSSTLTPLSVSDSRKVIEEFRKIEQVLEENDAASV